MMHAIGWMMAHWSDVVEALLALIGAASVVVRLTPTTRDDAAVARVVRAVEALSLGRRGPATVPPATPDRVVEALDRGDIAALLRELEAPARPPE